MREAILNFAKQFKYRPKIENGPVKKFKKYILAGMGGSHLAADIIKSLRPELDIMVHSDYGLPGGLDLSRPTATLPRLGEGKGRGRALIIASSYSGNTEEAIDAYEQARAKGLSLVAIATGGKLLELARQHQVPYIQMPDTGIQPRSALGYSMLAMLKAMKLNNLLKETKGLAKILDPKSLEEEGKVLAQKLRDHVPVIYTSHSNVSIAYNWKIKFNETGKIPAFYNVLPELNHNEMTGFDVKDSSRVLSEKFYFIFLRDDADHPKILRRMEVLQKLYQARGLPVEVIEMKGHSPLEKIFSSLLLADWAAYYTAETYGLESEQVPMVEEFKKLI